MAEFSYGFTNNDYNTYKNKSRRLNNEKRRGDNQTFADAMCEDSIVAGIELGEGKKILDAIKKLVMYKCLQRSLHQPI